MGTLGVHQNIPASDTKLTHSLCIYIGPPLVMDKLIPVNSRAITSPPEMGPLLDVECNPAVIIKPRFNTLRTRITLVGTKRSTSSDKSIFNLSTGLSALQIHRQGNFVILLPYLWKCSLASFIPEFFMSGNEIPRQSEVPHFRA